MIDKRVVGHCAGDKCLQRRRTCRVISEAAIGEDRDRGTLSAQHHFRDGGEGIAVWFGIAGQYARSSNRQRRIFVRRRPGKVVVDGRGRLVVHARYVAGRDDVAFAQRILLVLVTEVSRRVRIEQVEASDGIEVENPGVNGK